MLRAKIHLDRLDRDGRLLEHREQPARSFTRGFIELLYVLAAQPPNTARYTGMPDLSKVSRDLDITIDVTYFRMLSSILKVASPPGVSMQQLGANYATSVYVFPMRMALLGCDLGIQAGVDNTAVTPTDRRLGQRIGHGVRPSDAAPVVFESYVTGDDTDLAIYGVNWGAQPFIPKTSHRITSVRIKIWKVGAPGNLTVSIRGVDRGENPNGAACPDLASGTILQADIPAATPGALTECTFATPVDVYAGNRYVIVVRALTGDAANNVKWRYDTAGATYQRAYYIWSFNAFVQRLNSVDSGASWAYTTNACHMFEEKGQSVGEFEYGGCELYGLAFANPNGEFTIRRYFNNRCGSPITVNEVGIAAAAEYHGTTNGEVYVWPFLIARDVVAPGVTVLNNELLRVTYVPQITV